MQVLSLSSAALESLVCFRYWLTVFWFTFYCTGIKNEPEILGKVSKVKIPMIHIIVKMESKFLHVFLRDKTIQIVVSSWASYS